MVRRCRPKRRRKRDRLGARAQVDLEFAFNQWYEVLPSRRPSRVGMRDCSADRHDADRGALRREATSNIHGDLEHPCTWLGMLSALVAAGSSQNPLGMNSCRVECPRLGGAVLVAMRF